MTLGIQSKQRNLFFPTLRTAAASSSFLNFSAFSHFSSDQHAAARPPLINSPSSLHLCPNTSPLSHHLTHYNHDSLHSHFIDPDINLKKISNSKNIKRKVKLVNSWKKHEDRWRNSWA
ncbi:unnamed protein product [Vicia faba]|uniref:Uncharacterized protein n=1 Tax=Vicia faba TaxID=3906 RepID=A0AAV0ZXG0_VICFA|nr:unnamed protein product [Vicia faba]